MKAWDYRNHFLNIQGLISLKMALVWGALGAIFDKFLYKPLKEALSYVEGSVWDAICAAGSAFMIVNLTYTSLCIIRWANRHKNKPPLNRISRFIDRRYPNHWMEKKFCNWRFIGKRFVKGIFAKVIFGANQKTKGRVAKHPNKKRRGKEPQKGIQTSSFRLR